MRDLVVQSGNAATDDDHALAVNEAEIDQLQAEIDRVARFTRLGTLRLLDGSLGGDRCMDVVPADVLFSAGADAFDAEHATLTVDVVVPGDLGGVDGDPERSFALDGQALLVTAEVDREGTLTAAMGSWGSPAARSWSRPVSRRSRRRTSCRRRCSPCCAEQRGGTAVEVAPVPHP